VPNSSRSTACFDGLLVARCAGNDDPFGVAGLGRLTGGVAPRGLVVPPPATHVQAFGLNARPPSNGTQWGEEGRRGGTARETRR